MKNYIITLIIFIIIFIGYVYPKNKEINKKEDNLILIKEPLEEQTITNEKEIIVRETRLTSYWVNDDCNSEDMTASGKTTKDFKLNSNGWYTWNGMLIVATASNRLGKTSQKTYNLYDEIELIINDRQYTAVVLDVCGACMKYNRIDLFVKNKESMIDQQIKILDKGE